MFVVFIGSLLTTYLFVRDLPTASAADTVFTGLVAVWLWFTVLFANFAEAVAEGRGKAQADTLRKTRSETRGARAARRRIDRRAASRRSCTSAIASSSSPASSFPATAT